MLYNSIRRILVASGLTVATSFMTVLSASATTTTANDTGGFSGSIDPSCAVNSTFPNKSANKLPYTKTNFAGSGAGGVSKLSATQLVGFNCNSDTVDVSVDVTLAYPPTPVNATAIIGIHTTKITNANDEAFETGEGPGNNVVEGATGWVTDPDGNIAINVLSEWIPYDGEELLNGDYNAIIKVTVTPN